jgi:hypothetical protein
VSRFVMLPPVVEVSSERRPGDAGPAGLGRDNLRVVAFEVPVGVPAGRTPRAMVVRVVATPRYARIIAGGWSRVNT